MPPYNLLFGHLLTLKNVVSNLPSDIHGQLLPNQIQQAFSHLGPIFYVDTWPINAPLLIVASPDAARQITQGHSLSKFGALRNFLRPITGESNLITMEGEQWKIWRSIFNPGFSANHMMSLVPGIMKEILTFCDILREHALKGVAFPLTEVTTNLAMDVIGRVTL
jgi:sterigmatocystin biosynthesis cytochrome P450 monooxygenase